MKIKRISFSSRRACRDAFDWAYGLEDMGYTGWEIVQEGEQCLNQDKIGLVRDIHDTTDLELSLHLPFSDMNLASLNLGIHQEILRQMEDYLELASDFVELAVVHPGYLSPYGVQVPDKAWEQNVRSLQQLSDIAEEHGILLAVENMPDIALVFGRTPEEMLELIDDAGRENIKMTFDVGHANTMGMVDEFMIACRDHISHIHIHDNHGTKDEHLPLGKGNIDWERLFGDLSHYTGTFVTEMKDLNEGAQCLEYLKEM